ncbi:MAG: argininosuccinate lyase [Chloroflexi bacterium RBG_13_60_13]|nr:MAG: argininosuccinate lyase [Chloroflexi bacterium RBG_13_60_13]
MSTEHLRGRFKKDTDKVVARYIASIPFDHRLYRQDIAGSIAHARMLGKQGIILQSEADAIIAGLISIREEIEQGRLQFKVELEDIHMNVEARLIEKIGDVGGKLHTARSRNDQVALDLRIFCKEAIAETIRRLKELQSALLDTAEANRDVIMPGYTHLQRAQPVLLAHHLLAYFEMLQRDVLRFKDCLVRTDVMPLGSGALAGVPYPIDRDFVAHQLGFSRISQNSIDAVSDRDFVIEYLAAASTAMMHLSRLGEELVLWSTEEFGYVDINESFASASSIMPQKRNPDTAELARGKTGRVYGHLLGFLTAMKGLPLSYNRDLQEDKEGLFDTVDTLHSTLEVFTGMVRTVKVNAERAGQAVDGGYLLATDLADYLVMKGLPFRQAHAIVGKLVSCAAGNGQDLSRLHLEDYRRFSDLFTVDVLDITAKASVAARSVLGGTAPEQVQAQMARAREAVRDV